jgi:hypothetical protein
MEMKTIKKVRKPYRDLTDAELAAATADLDEEFVIDKFGTPPPEAKALWEMAKRKLGRPQRSKPGKVVPVPVEKRLLTRSDRLARKLGISRTEVIARCLQAGLDSTEKEGITK